MCEYKIGECSFIFDVEEFALVLAIHLYTETNAEHKASDSGDESREKRVEGKSAHQQTVGELKYTGEEYVRQIRVDRFQPFASVFAVLLEEFRDHGSQAGHLGKDLGTEK